MWHRAREDEVLVHADQKQQTAVGKCHSADLLACSEGCHETLEARRRSVRAHRESHHSTGRHLVDAYVDDVDRRGYVICQIGDLAYCVAYWLVERH